MFKQRAGRKWACSKKLSGPGAGRLIEQHGASVLFDPLRNGVGTLSANRRRADLQMGEEHPACSILQRLGTPLQAARPLRYVRVRPEISSGQRAGRVPILARLSRARLRQQTPPRNRVFFQYYCSPPPSTLLNRNPIHA